MYTHAPSGTKLRHDLRLSFLAWLDLTVLVHAFGDDWGQDGLVILTLGRGDN